MFLEKLIDILVSAWDHITPMTVVDAYEGGVVLRFGKYHRTLGPGMHFKIPLAERVALTPTCITTIRLPPQTITTKDNHSIAVSAIVKYSIVDVRQFITEVWDAVDVLADVTTGAIRKTVAAHTWAEVLEQGVEQDIVEKVRREVSDFGFKVHRVTFVDLGRVRSIRLIGVAPVPKDLAN